MHLNPPTLDGTWQLVRAELNGEIAPELVITKTELQFANGNYIVRFDGRITDRGVFEHGTSPENNTIILHGVEGVNASRTIPCIYQLAGNRLRVCYGLDGKTPIVFTNASAFQYLATYRRLK
jgi:uncharacterized protein (TIGR03067 family)